MKKGVLLGLVMLFYLLAAAQTGREFWFSIPYVDKSHDIDFLADGVTPSAADNSASLVKNYFRISTGEIGATVTFYKFTGGVQSVLYTATVAANSMTSVSVGNVGASNISLSAFVVDQYNTILQRGIFISSTAPISIYYEIGSPNNTELFTLKGKDALGTEFYPVLQNAFPNKSETSGGCGGWALDSWTTLDIVASEDNTVVTIDLPTAYTGGIQRVDVSTQTCQISPILKRRALAPDVFYPQNPSENVYTQVKTETYLNGTLQSSVFGAKTWLIDTMSADYCVTCGAKMIDAWWNDGGKPNIPLTYFQQQLNNTLFPTTKPTLSCSSSAIVSTTTVSPIVYSGSSITSVTLQKGNVYSVKAEAQTAVKLLGGAKITATKPVAVLMKDDGVFDGSCGGDMAGDIIGDQIVPTNKSGTAYIIPDFYEKITGAEGAQDEYLFIRALSNGTQISIAGETNPVATLNKGDVYRYSNFSQLNGYKLVTSNGKLFECYHLGGLPSNQTSVTEFAGALVPPVDSCTGSTITAFVRPENTTFRPVLISRTNTVGSFKYYQQGSGAWTVFNPTFTAVDINGDGSTDWYYASDANVGLGVPTSGVNYLIKNSEATFHFGFLQKRQTGTSHGCFYGYFSDFTAPELLIGFTFTDIDPTAVVDMRVLLSAVGAKEGTYDWDLVSPLPASVSCSDSYFPNIANCDKSNPITLSSAINAINGSFIYKCTGDNTCKAGKIANFVTFDIVASIATLPIELYYFKGHCVNRGVMLEWATLSETNNKEFTILRSFDGKDFQVIGKIAGQGTTPNKTYYSFMDSMANKRVAYYQLLQTDIDETHYRSKIINLTCNQTDCGSVYPTLCQNGETITIVCENFGDKLVRIVSLNGNIVFEKKLDRQSAANTLNLSLANGMYLLQIIENDEIVSQQQIMVW